MEEFFGTTMAPAAVGVMRAPTIATFPPPAAANTGGASPTPPMSTDPAPMACTIGGPEVKSTQLALNGSLLMSPAAFSSASAPVPFWLTDVQGDRGDVHRRAPGRGHRRRRARR